VVAASGFAGELLVETDALRAVACAETVAASRGAAVLVTGSLYLAGQVRRRWFADTDVILQRTPWPDRDSIVTSGAA
jgi:hypothetical protein